LGTHVGGTHQAAQEKKIKVFHIHQ
jgi:hypothetical protein